MWSVIVLSCRNNELLIFDRLSRRLARESHTFMNRFPIVYVFYFLLSSVGGLQKRVFQLLHRGMQLIFKIHLFLLLSFQKLVLSTSDV
jgi:hypothetical protein